MNQELGSDDCLKELFRNVYHVQELTGRILRQSTALGEISVNAAIAAGHTGSQSKVFTEIAKQIGVIAALLLQSIERIHQFTGPISTHTLTALIRSAQRERFVRVLGSIGGEANALSLRGVIDGLSGGIADLLEHSQEKLACARVEEQRIRLVVQRVWSISIGLRISASMAEIGEQAFFLSIAEALEKMAAGTSALVEELTVVVSVVERALLDRCQCMKGAVNAA